MVKTAEQEYTEKRQQGEHILVCLSSSPSNRRLVETAARMVQVFGGTFTAVYVETAEAGQMCEADKTRLRENTELAERLGAAIATVYGEDISFQIAEFARISGVTKIVIGRSNMVRRHFWSQPTLTERLVAVVPDIDIYIIPDASQTQGYRRERRGFLNLEPLSPRAIGITLLLLASATAVGSLFSWLKFTEANIITVYILSVLLTALFTKHFFCSVLSSLGSVLAFNFFFTEPRLTFHAYEPGYPATFVIMLIVSLMIGKLADQVYSNARQSVQAAVIAKTEQLRSNLLRAISHDLRTPLTSISGNAENLIMNRENLDEETKTQLLSCIYDDAVWLTGLVENLLSITRMENGRMQITMSVQLIDDVLEEAVRHIRRKGMGHRISIETGEELLLAKIDAKLIVQVVINLADNAIKYTPEGSTIVLRARKDGPMIAVSVVDNGPGIPDEMKARVFEMFFTGEHKVADSHRSLGLGLSLCRTIVEAHGGTICLRDNPPHGCDFTFTLPASEVKLNDENGHTGS